MTVLLDTSFLVAVASARDARHALARGAIRELTGKRIIAAPVLPEVFYMVGTRVNYSSAVQLFDRLRSVAFQIEPVTTDDMARMSQIMTEYRDTAFDFVDVAIMALAERLDIRTVYTLDRRDFMVFRPRHCAALHLLPEAPPNVTSEER